MRHVIGFAAALVLSAAVFFGGTWGLARLSGLTAHSGGMTSIPGLTALAAVAGTGLLLGILMAVPAVSPLASGLPGIALLAWSGVFAVNAHYALAWIPLRQAAFGQEFHTMLADGLLALLGTAMVFPLFVPSRWHGREEDVDAEFREELPAAKGLLS